MILSWSQTTDIKQLLILILWSHSNTKALNMKVVRTSYYRQVSLLCFFWLLCWYTNLCKVYSRLFTCPFKKKNTAMMARDGIKWSKSRCLLPLTSNRWPHLPKGASDGGFFLLKRSFSFPLSPSAYPIGGLLIVGISLYYFRFLILQHKAPWCDLCDFISKTKLNWINLKAK